MRVHRLPACILAAAASLASARVTADSGIYLGGGITQTRVEDSAGNPGGAPLDDKPLGAKLFAGYKLDALPLVKFAAEAGYRESGQSSGTIAAGDTKARLHGFDYGVLAGLGLGPVDLMARVGGFSYKLEKESAGVKRDFDGTAPVYGVGVWFTLFGLGLRVEYEKIDVRELDNVQVMAASVFYQF